MQGYKTEGVLPEMVMEEAVRMFLSIDFGYYENLIPSVAASVATQTLYENILAFEPLLVAYIDKAEKKLGYTKKDNEKRILYTATALAIEQFLTMNIQELAASYVAKILTVKRHIDIESNSFKKDGGIYAITGYADKRTFVQDLRKRAYAYQQN